VSITYLRATTAAPSEPAPKESSNLAQIRIARNRRAVVAPQERFLGMSRDGVLAHLSLEHRRDLRRNDFATGTAPGC
jgi:hypothetical protein